MNALADPLGLSRSVRFSITGCPDTPALAEKPPKEMSPAQWMVLRLAQAIEAFEKKLDGEHEVGFSLVSFGGQVLHADDLGFWAPDLVLFFGRNEMGAAVQIIQNVAQVNVMLVAARKQSEEPRRIGFEILRAGEGANP